VRLIASAILVAAGTLAVAAAAEPLPANTWVKVREKGKWADGVDVRKLTGLLDELEMTSGDRKAKTADWLLQDKKANYSSALRGVPDPELGRVLFVVGNSYRGSSLWAYNISKAGSWRKPQGEGRAPPTGWTKLEAGGDWFGGSLRWASAAYDPVNKELVLFGGNSSDEGGSPGTRLYSIEKNEWRRLNVENLPLHSIHAECAALRLAAAGLEGRLRSRWHLAETAEETKADLAAVAGGLAERVGALLAKLPEAAKTGEQEAEQVALSGPELEAAGAALKALAGSLKDGATAERIAKTAAVVERLRAARDLLAVEPPARANSPLAYDAKAKKIVLFGGDHLDYMTADTWVYDCASRRWRQRRPAVSPAPRGGHALVYLPKPGRVALAGGYAYGSEEGYAAGDYRYRPLELWTYEVAADRWSLLRRWDLTKGRKVQVEGGPTPSRSKPFEVVAGEDDTLLHLARGREGDAVWALRVDAAAEKSGAAKSGAKPGAVERRTGKYVPTWWDALPPADAAASEKFLEDLPPNTWVAPKPPKGLNRNRDWGTATFDTDRLQVLWFSGGHCAYSGTDVSIYSTRANRWRLSAAPEMPIEFCRGTGYHAQNWSFGGRPFMSSHTYKLYAYDPAVKKMVLCNRNYFFIFDPAAADWEWSPRKLPFKGGWTPKLCTTPEGVMAWAPPAKGAPEETSGLWRFDAAKRAWAAVEIKGAKAPATPGDDYGTIVYDLKRKRLLLFGIERRSKALLGVWACDPAAGTIEKIEPENPKAVPAFPRESVYLPKGDLVLFAAPRGEGAVVYDVAGNRFRTLKIANPTPPSSKLAYGGTSCGLMYDPKRDLVWTVYSGWQLRVMRFDPKTAEFSDGEAD